MLLREDFKYMNLKFINRKLLKQIRRYLHLIYGKGYILNIFDIYISNPGYIKYSYNSTTTTTKITPTQSSNRQKNNMNRPREYYT